jgi:ribosomal protein S21
MSVVVYNNEPIENALKRLHREVMIEEILDKLKDKQYFVKKSVIRSEQKKVWMKTKRRGRSAARKLRRKGASVL